MGWNCNNCGYLLMPSRKMLDQQVPSIKGIYHKVRHAICPHCRAQFIILEGQQPRPYLNSVMICIDDGEEK